MTTVQMTVITVQHVARGRSEPDEDVFVAQSHRGRSRRLRNKYWRFFSTVILGLEIDGEGRISWGDGEQGG